MLPNMHTIWIRQKDGVAEYEHHLRGIQQDESILRLPSTISAAGALGRSISFAQFIATWASHSIDGCAWTTLPANDIDRHIEYVSRFHGLATAYYAKQILSSDKTANLRQPLLEAAAPRIINMSKRNYSLTAKGPLVELIFVNRAQAQFHLAMYIRKPEIDELMDPQLHGKLVVSTREMNALFASMLSDLAIRPRDATRIAPLFQYSNGPIGHLLHETFRNTAEHAYLDENGKIPKQGLRCVLIAIRRMESKNLQAGALISAQHEELEEYFQFLRSRENSKYRKHVFILEISVLDTGPGLAKTLRTLPGNNDADDVTLVTRCFKDHVSSKPGENSGLGLGRVLENVRNLDGFLRIRTSTTEAFFSSYTPVRKQNDNMPSVCGNLSEVVGTALTIGIPLEL